jgi:hypothetical protein
VSLRSSLGSGCARTASPRAARLLHVPVRWAAQDGGCRKKAHLEQVRSRQVISAVCPASFFELSESKKGAGGGSELR